MYSRKNFAPARRVGVLVRKFLVVASLAGAAALALGAPADIMRGLAWLGAQVQAGGQLQTESRVAAAQQAQCETAATLLKLAGDQAQVAALVSSLRQLPVADTASETLACVQDLRQKLGETVLASALDERRVDGRGWSAYGGVQVANALDTGWALGAQLKNLPATDRARALEWLQSIQAVNGSFAVNAEPHMLATAVILRALKDEASTNPIAAGIATKAASYLLAQRSAATQWLDDAAVTAIVYEAVHPYTAGNASVATGVESYLLSRQQPDGSWQGDAYVTAVALRALALAGQAPLDPTQAVLKVRFADARTAAFIPGVAFTGTGTAALSAASDAAGLVELRGIAAGPYQLKAGLIGYATVSFSVSPKAGETLDLGVVQMLPPVSATVAVISGTVRAQGDNAPLAGVSVNVVGQSANATTSADGRYLISGVVPGTVTVAADKAGYASAAAQMNAIGGQALNFSPVLVAVEGTGTVADCKIQGQIVNGQSLTPLDGVAVSVSGAVSQSTSTDAQGRFTMGNLASGAVQITASKAGYALVRVNTRLMCSPGRLSVVDFSPRMYPGTQGPADANTAGMTGVVVDARTSAPIANAQLWVTPDIGAAKTTLTVADGSFAFAGLDGATAQLRIQATGYESLTVQYSLTPLRTLDLAQIRLRPPRVEQILPDLKMVVVRRHTALTNAQSLQLTGAVQAVLVNAGTQQAPAGVPLVAFNDTNGNGRYDVGVDLVLGSASAAASLVPGQTTTLEINVMGVLPFRDAPIHVVADPDNQLAELSKTNNLRSTAQDALATVVTKPFVPKLKWEWTGSSQYPEYNQVMAAPVVGQFIDTNGDGLVNEQDNPMIIFVSFPATRYVYYIQPGVVRAIDGVTGQERFTFYDPVYSPSGSNNLAIADIDNDGFPDLIGTTIQGRVVALGRNGPKWLSPVVTTNTSGGVHGPVAVADIDGDGSPEILAFKTVLNNNGTVKWTANALGEPAAMAADLFGTGQQNVILGGNVYKPDGQLLWSNLGAFAGVADFEGNGIPSVVTTGNGMVSMYSREGQLKWRVAVPGSYGGPPTIADADGDGKPDIALMNTTFYTVFRGDGSILWSVPIGDPSGFTGTTFFDFDGDGANEILYSDETSLRVFKGSTGQVLWSISNTSGTSMENPVVVDVDRDGHADIVVPANNYFQWYGNTGIRVFEDTNKAWVPTRSIWNQYNYSINNINDDLSVPRNPVPSWQTHNTFRLNQRVDGSGRAIADVTVGYARVADAGAAGASVLTVRVGNAGSYKVPAGLKVAFYSSNPALGTPSVSARLGTASIPSELQPGQHADVSVSITNIAGLPAVWVVGDDDGAGRTAVADFDRLNNVHVADLSAIALNVRVGVVADKASYTEQEQAVFTSSVTNAGSFARAAQVRVSVLDAAGRVVQQLPLGAVVDVATGASVAQPSSWPVAGVLSGSYTVLSELVTAQGLVYGSATASFVVSASQAVANTARVSADRASYTAAQAVQLTSRITNQTANVVQENLQARTVVTGGSGVAVLTQTEAIAQLAAGGQRQYSYSLAASGLAVGGYTARLELLQGASVLAQSTTGFTVVGSDQSGIGLAGSVQAQPSVALVGQPVQLSGAATYSGNAVLANVPVTVRVLEPASGTVLASFTSVVTSWTPGASQTFAHSWTSQGLDGQVLVAAATAQVNGRDIALGQATIRLQGVAQLEVLPDRLNFAPLRVGEQAQQALTLRSVGSLAVTSLTLSLDGADASQFVLPSGGCMQTGTLAVGATCTAVVSYRPNAAGEHAAQLAVGYSGSVGVSATLTGQATAVGFTGSVAADPAQAVPGQSVDLGYSLTNPASVSATAAFTLAVYDSQGVVLQSWPLQVGIAAGATYAGNQAYTAPSQQQTLTVALQKPGTGLGDALATATFAVVAPPPPVVRVDLAALLKRDARVLMLASCPQGQSSHGDGHGERNEREEHDDDDDDRRRQRAESCEPQPDVPSCLTARVQAAGDLLSELGVVHKIVTSEAAFKHELRCGGYNTYWVSGGAAKLDHWLVKEVREAIWRGDSLVMDGEHDDRNQLLHPLAGVKYRGKLGRSNLTASIPAGSLFAAGSLATLGQPAKFDLEGGQRQASFTGSYAQTPAIISSSYGAGRSLVFAFDLVGMTALASGPTAQVRQLVQTTAGHLANGTSTVAVGDSAALALTVNNPGTRTVAVQVIASVPTGVTHTGAAPEAASVNAGSVTWELSVPGGASQEIVWRVRTTQAGTVSLPVTVYSLPEGTGAAQLQASAQVQLHVAAGSALLQAVLPQLQALQPSSSSGRANKTQAINAANSALAHHMNTRYQDALVQWATSANALIAITSADTRTARDAVAKAMEATSSALCQTLACLGGSISLAGQPLLGSTLGVTRGAANMCPAPVRDVDLVLELTNRRTRQTVLNLQDDNLTLNGGQASQRQASVVVQGQVGDVLEALLTANWQGHQIELAKTSAPIAQNTGACQAGQPLAANRFTAHGAGEGLFAQGGKSGGGGSSNSHSNNGDWEWALGADVRQSGKYVSEHMDWDSGDTYTWYLQVNPNGQGNFTVRDGGRTVASDSYAASSKLKLGNALRIGVKATGDVGSARIAASLTKLNGQGVSLSLATDAPGQDRGAALYQPGMSGGYTAEGTLKLNYGGSAPPQGAKLQFSVQGGSASCQ